MGEAGDFALPCLDSHPVPSTTALSLDAIFNCRNHNFELGSESSTNERRQMGSCPGAQRHEALLLIVRLPISLSLFAKLDFLKIVMHDS